MPIDDGAGSPRGFDAEFPPDPLDQSIKVVPDRGDEVVEDMQVVKNFLLNLVFNQQLLGKEILIGNTISYFPLVNKAQINRLIDQLCEEGKIAILGSSKKPQEQLVCLLVAKAS